MTAAGRPAAPAGAARRPPARPHQGGDGPRLSLLDGRLRLRVRLLLLPLPLLPRRRRLPPLLRAPLRAQPHLAEVGLLQEGQRRGQGGRSGGLRGCRGRRWQCGGWRQEASQ